MQHDQDPGLRKHRGRARALHKILAQALGFAEELHTCRGANSSCNVGL